MDDGSGSPKCFGGFTLNCAARQLLDASGTAVPLTPKAFDVLLYLVSHAQQTVLKDDLITAVWPDTVVEENNLTQAISALRKALGERRGEHRFIVTIPGRGYRFVAPVTDANHGYNDPQAGQAVTEAGKQARFPAVPRHLRPLLVAAGALAVLFVLADALWLPTEPGVSTEPRTVAVLPYRPLGATSRNEAMELGMADSVIAALSDSDQLIVRPLSVVRRYSAPDADPLQAGRELEVDFVVDGTLSVVDDRVRVSTRVLRVADGRQLLADQVDERYADIFRLQDRIARQVAGSLSARLADQPAHTPANLAAYENYVLGRWYAGRLVLPDVLKGIEYFKLAIEADPTYASPYVGIAEAQRALVLSNDIPATDLMPLAKAAALRATELEPQLAEARYALGMIALFYDWDWAEAETQLSLAVELSPNSAEAHIFYAHLLSNTGRKEAALEHARRARALNPASLLVNALEGQFLGHLGEPEAAIGRLRAAIELDPRFWLSHHLLANVLADTGNYAAAVAEAEEASRLSPRQFYSEAVRGYALARAGERDQANAVLEGLLERGKERYVPPTYVALVHLGLGNLQESLDFLQTGFETRDVRMAFLKSDPKWQALGGEARFIELLRQLRFD